MRDDQYSSWPDWYKTTPENIGLRWKLPQRVTWTDMDMASYIFFMKAFNKCFCDDTATIICYVNFESLGIKIGG